MELVAWVVRDDGLPRIIKIPVGAYPSNAVGIAPQGFEPGDEKFIRLIPPKSMIIDFEAWRKAKDPGFIGRLKEGWKP